MLAVILYKTPRLGEMMVMMGEEMLKQVIKSVNKIHLIYIKYN